MGAAAWTQAGGVPPDGCSEPWGGHSSGPGQRSRVRAGSRPFLAVAGTVFALGTGDLAAPALSTAGRPGTSTRRLARARARLASGSSGNRNRLQYGVGPGNDQLHRVVGEGHQVRPR